MPSRTSLCGWVEEGKGSAQGSYCLSNGEGSAVQSGAELTLMGKWEVGGDSWARKEGGGTKKSKRRNE